MSDVDKWSRNSIKKKGPKVNQVITFIGGYKTTFKKVLTDTIEQGAMTHFETEDGRLILVNTPNVLCVEVIRSEPLEEKQ